MQLPVLIPGPGSESKSGTNRRGFVPGTGFVEACGDQRGSSSIFVLAKWMVTIVGYSRLFVMPLVYVLMICSQ